ncbi:ABC transporter substrate-binding protein/permease [Nocardioides pantholopis]|uniref:ABC transporter substrate-binding protein/permease n=1 Tax=Nocardioides pantholopis TaxID=2483798 RepID=UPI000F09608C|nr:ABC transporter substrate-binding protein/permease [Nocardioides pantholopis]
MRPGPRSPRLLWAFLLLVGVVGMLLASGSPVAAQEQDERRVVRVGTEGTYPPFSFVDPRTGELTGYDIEVIEAVADRAGWDLEFVRARFDALFPALDAERIDVIANQVTVNPEREARYLLSRPYTYSRGVIVTAADTDDITSLEDLEGRTTAQTETSNWAQVARDAGARVQSVEGFAQTAELLAQGRVDATVNDNIAVLDYLASTGSDEIKIAGEIEGEQGEQALVFRQSETALHAEANRALEELADDGTLAEISEEYFGADVSVPDGGDVDLGGSDTGRSRWDVVQDAAWPMLRGTIKGTIPLTIVSFVLGLAIALAVALARLSPSRLLTLPARFYVSVIRGTPLLVQLFIVFYGLPQVGVKMPSYVAACLALSLNVGGYGAEIIRSSILAVPRGQLEAARTIGMEYWQALRRIILPQAARIAVPPLSNTLLSLVKDTSLASLVLVPELFLEAQVAAALSTEYLPLYALAALYYWVVCYVVSLGQGRLERRLGRYAV